MILNGVVGQCPPWAHIPEPEGFKVNVLFLVQKKYIRVVLHTYKLTIKTSIIQLHLCFF